MKNKIRKINEQIIEIDKIKSFSVIGDPGCDGLGAEIMATFSKALIESTGDFIIVLGDIVPFGSRNFYENIIEFIESIVNKPVYMLCGNHDTQYYDEYFGKRDYALVDDKTLIIILDNSKRYFSKESIDLLSYALESYSRPNIVLMMHIPPPNLKSSNSINGNEWNKVQEKIRMYNATDKIKYLVCGHLHSYFEEDFARIKLVVTGGGGARIEEIPGIHSSYNHFVEFSLDDNNSLKHEKKDISFTAQDYNDSAIYEMLENSFKNECIAHVRYMLYAEDAHKRGLYKLARLFRATSDAEFHHARNHYYAMAKVKEPMQAVVESLEKENYEIETMYREYIDYSREKRIGLPQYAFTDAYEAEKVHYNLFKKAESDLREGKDIFDSDYYTCTSCGYTFSGDTCPKVCPICGAPEDKIKDVQ